jgi:hypothetical protein
MTRSTAETEYRAMTLGVVELLWLTSMLVELLSYCGFRSC